MSEVYDAYKILINAGYNPNEILKVLNEIGFRIENLNEIKQPKRQSPLIKALYYHEAYKLALKLRKEKGWGYRRISREIEKKLGIKIPAYTVRGWICRGCVPNIIPIRIDKELGYIIGTLMSDGTRNIRIKLCVKDKDYAEHFSKALEKVTEKKYQVKEKRGVYIVSLRGTPLLYLVNSRLWKLIAYLYPKEYLQGLFDGDGGVIVGVRTKKRFEFEVIVHLTNSNLQLLEFVRKLLKERFEIESTINLKQEKKEISKPVGNECTKKRSCWRLCIRKQKDIIKFYENIGFRISRKQEKLRDVVIILRKYHRKKERVEAWLKMYMKVNNKWVKFHNSS